MFPHEFDRYNILYFLVNHYFKQLKLKRSEFQEKCGLSQSATSNFLNFEHAKAIIKRKKGTTQGQRPYKTETLEKAIACFGLPDKETAALIWLLEFDSKRFQKAKILEMLDYVATTDIKAYSSEKSPLKEIQVELAGFKGLFNKNSANNNFKDQSEILQHRLFKMSNEPGHRMVVSKFPTSATHPEIIDKKVSFQMKSRLRNFSKNIREKGFGERHIHSKPTILRYLNENSDCSFLPIEKRREHIQNLIETLSNPLNVNFQVGLAENEPEIELAMRSIDVVAIRTTAREILLSENPFSCGHSYLFIHDKNTVLSCYLDFEREWEQISQNFREKKSVIEWLKNTLETSVKQKRRKDDT